MSTMYKLKIGRGEYLARGITVDGEIWAAAADLTARVSIPRGAKPAPDWRGMLRHLMAQVIEPAEGERHPVGMWIAASARMRKHPDPWKAGANGVLPAYGMKVVGKGDTAQIVIANRHPRLAGLFTASDWAGAWRDAAARAPGAARTDPLSFDGVVSRGWRIPLTSIPDLTTKPDS